MVCSYDPVSDYLSSHANTMAPGGGFGGTGVPPGLSQSSLLAPPQGVGPAGLDGVNLTSGTLGGIDSEYGSPDFSMGMLSAMGAAPGMLLATTMLPAGRQPLFSPYQMLTQPMLEAATNSSDGSSVTSVADGSVASAAGHSSGAAAAAAAGMMSGTAEDHWAAVDHATPFEMRSESPPQSRTMPQLPSVQAQDTYNGRPVPPPGFSPSFGATTDFSKFHHQQQRQKENSLGMLLAGSGFEEVSTSDVELFRPLSASVGSQQQQQQQQQQRQLS
jgi:hypothetical protein